MIINEARHTDAWSLVGHVATVALCVCGTVATVMLVMGWL